MKPTASQYILTYWPHYKLCVIRPVLVTSHYAVTDYRSLIFFCFWTFCLLLLISCVYLFPSSLYSSSPLVLLFVFWIFFGFRYQLANISLRLNLFLCCLLPTFVLKHEAILKMTSKYSWIGQRCDVRSRNSILIRNLPIHESNWLLEWKNW